MPDPIAQLNDALDGRYSIERELGEGGMATVYLADDLKHERKVGLKVLKPELAAVVGAERFLAEIKTTANLQHPHILPLFDSGEAGGFLFYVMPFVAGESLRERIDRDRQLPVEEAVRISKGVASALDYAHRHGVIHRDVKPQNILLHDGEPMVADFGIALALSAAGGGRLTETGLSLGTPYYMSPEQAAADRDPGPTSDVYSLGCVLFEMLVGDPPHKGSSAQAVLAKILTEEPRSVAELRGTVPPHVAAVVAKSLERLPADRFETAGSFAAALDDSTFAHGRGGTRAGSGEARMVPAPHATGRPSRALHGLLIALPALTIGVAVGFWLRGAPSVPVPDPVRFTLGGDSIHAPVMVCCGATFAISPDGRSLAYQGISGSEMSVWLRSLDDTQARRIAGTEGAAELFFSPDGRTLGFRVGPELRRISLEGGSPSVILDGLSDVWGAEWMPDNTIVFSSGVQGIGLLRVSAEGGPVDTLTFTDDSRREGIHSHPTSVPDGSGVFFSVITLGVSDRWIEYLDLETGERREVTRGSFAQYTGDHEAGHLAFAAAEGAVMALEIDPSSGEAIGSAFRVEDGVIIRPFGTAEYAISLTGTLAARRGEGVTLALARVDRTGTAEHLGPVGDMRAPRFSPDGTRIVYEVQGDLTASGDEIWILDLDPAGPEQRLTFEGDNSWPTWGPDGTTILFDRDVAPDSLEGVYVRPSDFSGTAEWILRRDVWEPSLTADGRWLVWSENGQQLDLWIRDMESGEERAFLSTPAEETSPAVSPDGRWIAYSSTESGAAEVYVQPCPDGGPRRRVSRAGGYEPIWTRDGRELLYRSGTNVVSLGVTPGDEWRPGVETVLFQDRFERGVNARNWDVAPDGRSFVMMDGSDASAVTTVTVNALARR